MNHASDGYIIIEDCPRIRLDKRCHKELQALLNGYGKSKHFNLWFLRQLLNLNDPDIDCLTAYPNVFEPVKGSEYLYAMTYRRQQKNIRILYTYSKDDIRILLCSFDEKSKSDYDLNIPRAMKRMKQIPEEEMK